MAEAQYNAWYDQSACHITLPEVCEGGMECRNKIYEETIITMTATWKATLDRVAEKIADSWHDGKRILTEGYQEEFLCESGCYCEEIEETYIDHIRLRNEIEREIDLIQTDVRQLIQKQNEVLTNCPDYADTLFPVDPSYLE